jgi:hypothetical protein
MKVLLAAAVLLVSGCSAVGVLPSVKYCNEVEYTRIGNTFEIEAKDCKIPMAGGLGR